MKLNKKKQKVIGVLSLVVSLFIYFFIITPWYEIDELKNSYVSVVDKKVVLSQSRPVNWVNLKNVDALVVKAIVISEDWAFYHHYGIDIRQIYHSLKDFLLGKGLRGASTISQQLVKNVYFSNKRSFFRKFYELFYTLFMEFKLTKAEILEKYLNIIELGDGVYGIKDGAKEYFDLLPHELNTRQGAFLAMLLPSPVKYSESFRQKKLTDYAQKTINKILDKMVVGHMLASKDRDFYKSIKFSWEKNDEKYEEFLDYE